MEWYYILGIFSYSIFLIQFILSLFGAETDLDIDLDGDADFSIGDLVSFKGLIHFLMGLTGYLMVTGECTTLTVILGCLVGIALVWILYWTYRLIMHFESSPTKKYGEDLIGERVTVWYKCVVGHPLSYFCAVKNGGMFEEITCIANTPAVSGDVRTIIGYKNGIYYIS